MHDIVQKILAKDAAIRYPVPAWKGG